MSDEIRPIEGFSSMRPISPYYGGADLTVPSGVFQQPSSGAPYPVEPQIPEFAYESSPVAGAVAGPQGSAAAVPSPDARLSHVMKMLDDPKYHREFCSQFQDYMREMNPNEKLMTPPAGASGAAGGRSPHMGRGLPMAPGIGQKSHNFKDGGGGLEKMKAGSSIGDEINLSGSVDDRISQLQNGISQLESRKSELEGQIQQLESEIQELETQLQELEDQKRGLEEERQKKQEELSQAKQEQQKLQQQRSQLMAQRDELNNQKQTLSNNIQSLNTKITQLTSQIGSMRASAASMHAQAAAMLANPYTAAAGAALEAEAAVLDVQTAALEAQKAQLLVQKQQDECQLGQVEGQIGQINSQLNQIGPQIEAADNKVKILEGELAKIDEQLSPFEEQVAQLTEQQAAMKKQLADMKSELAQVKVKIAKLQKALDDHVAYKNSPVNSQNTTSGTTPKVADQLAALAAMSPKAGLGNLGDGSALLGGLAGKGILGGGRGSSRESGGEEAAASGKQVSSPGGPVDMRARRAEPSQQVSQFGPNPTQEQVGQMLEETALKYGIPQDMMKAVAWNDSKFDPKAGMSDGEAQGAINVAADLNPDYDVARGNRNPSYNIEQGGKGIKSQFEHTGDWKMAVSRFYGGGENGSSAASQVLELAMAKPWEASGGPGAMNMNLNMMQGIKKS